MAKRRPWSNERYALAVKGYADIPGLRKLVKGFESSDRYDLRKIDEWTRAMKRRVRDYDERVHLLLAQERRIVFPRDPEKIKKLQGAFHGDVASRSFKAVFVPYVAPLSATKERTEGKISYTTTGITIDHGFNRRHLVLFDQYALAVDPEAEVMRCLAVIPNAELFYIQVNEFQTLNAGDAPNLARQVLKWVAKYDGRTELTSGRHKGDNPAQHHYSKWMKGVVGYEFPEGIDPMEIARKIYLGMKDAKKTRHENDLLLRRIARKKKKDKKAAAKAVRRR
jgi:hypothetical protein